MVRSLRSRGRASATPAPPNRAPCRGGNYPWLYQVDPANGGTIQYSVTGSAFGCHIEGQEAIDLDQLGAFMSLVLTINDGDPLTYALRVSMAPGDPSFEVTRSSCTDPNLNGPLPWFPGIPGRSIAVSAPDAPVGTAGALQGSNTGTLFAVPQTWQWNLTPGG